LAVTVFEEVAPQAKGAGGPSAPVHRLRVVVVVTFIIYAALSRAGASPLQFADKPASRIAVVNLALLEEQLKPEPHLSESDRLAQESISREIKFLNAHALLSKEEQETMQMTVISEPYHRKLSAAEAGMRRELLDIWHRLNSEYRRLRKIHDPSQSEIERQQDLERRQHDTQVRILELKKRIRAIAEHSGEVERDELQSAMRKTIALVVGIKQ